MKWGNAEARNSRRVMGKTKNRQSSARARHKGIMDEGTAPRVLQCWR
jgi:hypothetical protein